MPSRWSLSLTNQLHLNRAAGITSAFACDSIVTAHRKRQNKIRHKTTKMKIRSIGVEEEYRVIEAQSEPQKSTRRNRGRETKMNGRLLRICIGILGVLSVATVGRAESVVNLITNGDFSGGLSGWTPESWSTGWDLPWLVDVNSGQLHWKRPQCYGGNGVAALQSLNVDVSQFNSLIFKFDVMPIYQSLGAPGLYGVEYPANVFIAYIDVNGNNREFWHGFHYSPAVDIDPAGYSGEHDGTYYRPAYPGTYVPQNTWYSYQTDDLLKLPAKPKTITGVFVCGGGWEFEGKAKNVQLLASGLTARPLQIVTQPTSQVGYWGKSITLSASVTDSASSSVSYQWMKGNTPIPGATQPTLVLSNLQLADAAAYSVLVSDSVGNSVSSSPANLVVNPAGVSIAMYAGVAIDGVVGQTYGIQASVDLANPGSWAGVANVTLTQPTQIWYDSQSTAQQPKRFYRVVAGPISIP